jgi:hypothetical protein
LLSHHAHDKRSIAPRYYLRLYGKVKQSSSVRNKANFFAFICSLYMRRGKGSGSRFHGTCHETGSQSLFDQTKKNENRMMTQPSLKDETKRQPTWLFF